MNEYKVGSEIDFWSKSKQTDLGQQKKQEGIIFPQIKTATLSALFFSFNNFFSCKDVFDNISLPIQFSQFIVDAPYILDKEIDFFN